jgi:hypothetical protein
MFAPRSTISADDTAKVYVDWECQVANPAYASLIFQRHGGTQSAVFVLKPDSNVATRLKASIPAAKLKDKARSSAASLLCYVQPTYAKFTARCLDRVLHA